MRTVRRIRIHDTQVESESCFMEYVSDYQLTQPPRTSQPTVQSSFVDMFVGHVAFTFVYDGVCGQSKYTIYTEQSWLWRMAYGDPSPWCVAIPPRLVS